MRGNLVRLLFAGYGATGLAAAAAWAAGAPPVAAILGVWIGGAAATLALAAAPATRRRFAAGAGEEDATDPSLDAWTRDALEDGASAAPRRSGAAPGA